MSTQEPATEAIAPDFVARRRPGVSSVELDGEVVLYDDATGKLHHLNPQATLLWSCFDGSGPLSELVDDLSGAYQVDPATMESQVLALARQLGDEGLLEGVGARPAESSVADGTETPFLPDPPNP